MSKAPFPRRAFLSMAAGGLAAAATPSAISAGPNESPDRALATRGKVSGLIDCQSHLWMPEMLDLMERRQSDPVAYRKDGQRYCRMGDWHRKVLPKHSDVDAKLADMDANGIEMTALSINDPGPEWFGDATEGLAVARMANNYIARIVARYPKRFFGLCVLPWQDVQACLKELDRCVRQLGMRGLLVYTNLAGRFADEPQYRPVLARAAELDLPVLLHPAKPVTIDAVKEYEMISFMGNMFDNTIALTRIIMAGILDTLPELKLVCPHLGGTLPYIVGRLNHQTQVLKRGPKYLTKPPSEYLKQVWLDVVSPLPLAMRFAYDFMGPGRLLFASDHPWVDPKLIIDDLQSLALPPEHEKMIFSENARRLFKL